MKSKYNDFKEHTKLVFQSRVDQLLISNRADGQFTQKIREITDDGTLGDTVIGDMISHNDEGIPKSFKDQSSNQEWGDKGSADSNNVVKKWWDVRTGIIYHDELDLPTSTESIIEIDYVKGTTNIMYFGRDDRSVPTQFTPPMTQKEWEEFSQTAGNEHWKMQSEPYVIWHDKNTIMELVRRSDTYGDVYTTDGRKVNTIEYRYNPQYHQWFQLEEYKTFLKRHFTGKVGYEDLSDVNKVDDFVQNCFEKLSDQGPATSTAFAGKLKGGLSTSVLLTIPSTGQVIEKSPGVYYKKHTDNTWVEIDKNELRGILQVQGAAYLETLDAELYRVADYTYVPVGIRSGLPLLDGTGLQQSSLLGNGQDAVIPDSLRDNNNFFGLAKSMVLNRADRAQVGLDRQRADYVTGRLGRGQVLWQRNTPMISIIESITTTNQMTNLITQLSSKLTLESTNLVKLRMQISNSTGQLCYSLTDENGTVLKNEEIFTKDSDIKLAEQLLSINPSDVDNKQTVVIEMLYDLRKGAVKSAKILGNNDSDSQRNIDRMSTSVKDGKVYTIEEERSLLLSQYSLLLQTMMAGNTNLN